MTAPSRSSLARFGLAVVWAAAGLLAPLPQLAAQQPESQGVHGPGSEVWLVHRTEAFRIIYQAEDAAAATHVASIAGELLSRAGAFMGYLPEEPIPVVIYGDTARANGFFSPYPPHIALYVARPAAPFLGARTPDWLEAVFVHELVHYLHLTRPIGFFGSASRVFGPLASAGSLLFLPGWAIEGPTVVAETELTRGGRGRDPFFEMEWVAPVLERNMYSYDQAGTGSVYAPRGRIYSAGYIMVDHLRAAYGDDAFRELNRRFQNWPFLGMRRALRATTGISARDFHANMVAELQQRYAPRLALPGGTPAVPHEAASWHLIGTGGGYVWAQRSSPVDPGSIMRRPIGAGTTDGADATEGADARAGWERVTTVTPLDVYSAAVSPDGRTLAAVVVTRTAEPDPEALMTSWGELVLMRRRADGRWTEAERITERTRLFHPALGTTAGGDLVILAGERDGSFSRVVEVDPMTGDRRKLLSEAGAHYATPTVGPQAEFVAATVNRAGRQSVVIARRSGGGLAAEVDLGGERDAEYRPRLLRGPEGALELWITADASGTLALYRVKLDAEGVPTATTRVVRDRVGVTDGFPLDERHIIYGSYRSNGPTIRTAPAPVAPDLESPAPQDLESPAAPGPGSGAREPAVTARVRRGTEAGPASSAGVGASRLPSGESIITASRRYRDWPRPILWLPTVSLAGEVDGPSELEVGGGVIAASTLARHDLSLFAGVNTGTGFGSGTLDYRYQPGLTSFELALRSQGIGASDPAEREQGISVGAERLLWYRENGQRARALRGGLGLEYRNTAGTGQLQLSASGALRSARYRGPAQIYGGVGSGLQTRVAYRPALLDAAEAGYAGVTTASAALGRGHGWLRFLPELSLATSGSAAARGNLPYSGASFAPEGSGALEGVNAAWLGAMSLGVALPPVDAAWRGVALQQTGLRFYVEQAAGTGLSPDNNSLVGLELSSTLQFNTIPLDLRAGAALRVPHGAEAGAARLSFFLGLGGAALDQVSLRSTRNRPASPATESTRLRF